MENRRIEVTTEVRRKIEKTFGVTRKTVANALNYTGDRGQTDLAKRIRVMALENGGRHMVSWPECETIHDEGTGEMIQTFDNGARLVINKKTGYAVVKYPNGEPHMGWDNVKVTQIPVLQEIAVSL